MFDEVLDWLSEGADRGFGRDENRKEVNANLEVAVVQVGSKSPDHPNWWCHARDVCDDVV